MLTPSYSYLSVAGQQLQGNRASVLGSTRGHFPNIDIDIEIDFS